VTKYVCMYVYMYFNQDCSRSLLCIQTIVSCDQVLFSAVYKVQTLAPYSCFWSTNFKQSDLLQHRLCVLPRKHTHTKD